MNIFILMAGVTACYTITSLSDKYAASSAEFSGDEFTFLMCSSLSIFLLPVLPFLQMHCTFSWQSFAAVLLVAVCKMLEFQMSAAVLKQLSAFELKAWMGTTLFVSYFTDVVYGADLRMSKLGCLVLAALGLVFIVRSEKEDKTDYRQIALPLILYLASKYGYGMVIKGFTPYISSTAQLLPALVLISLVLLAKVSPRKIYRKNPRGVLTVTLARIPNAAGMLLENAVISISLTSYSLIQPMILVTLFVIGLLRRESQTRLNLFGSILCAAGIVLFQFF